MIIYLKITAYKMNILELPDDILNTIFLCTTLAFDDLVMLSRTCKHFHKLISEFEHNEHYRKIISRNHILTHVGVNEFYQYLKVSDDKIIYNGYKTYTSKEGTVVCEYYRGKLHGSYQVFKYHVYIGTSEGSIILCTGAQEPIISGQYTMGIQTGKWTTIVYNQRYVRDYDNDPKICHIYDGQNESYGPLINDMRQGEWNIHEHFSYDIHHVGTYINDKKNGIWTTQYNDCVDIAEYVDDKLHGVVRQYRGTKYLIESRYHNGIQHGVERTYIDNRLIKEIIYEHGKLEGPFKEYMQDGQLIREGYYHNGLKYGKWVLYSYNGDKKEGLYQDDTRVGLWKVYRDTKYGLIRGEGHYINNRRTGEWKFYNANDKLVKVVIYITP